MMMLLSQKEYNELVKKATAVDLIVEERVVAEKERIWAALRKGLGQPNEADLIRSHPIEYVRNLLNKVIG